MVRMIAPRARATRLRLWCDNLGVVYMVNKLSTRSERCSKLVDELVWLAVTFDLELSVAHIATHRNVLADAGTSTHLSLFHCQIFVLCVCLFTF